jgi:hypothetical protein
MEATKKGRSGALGSIVVIQFEVDTATTAAEDHARQS